MAEPKMWEYDVVAWGADSSWSGQRGLQGLAGMLTQKGDDGWELSVFYDEISTGPRYFIFKRPKKEAPKNVTIQT